MTLTDNIAKWGFAFAAVSFFGSFTSGLLWGANGFMWAFALAGLAVGVSLVALIAGNLN